MGGTTLWKGAIHFGESTVPVKLHTAVHDERVQFHLLHSTDAVRLRQQMVCAYEKQPVPAEEQTKGFEVEEGKYLIVDPAELETTPESSRIIEVREFVPAGQVDALLVDRTYTLEPDRSAVPGTAYAALAAVMEELGVAGICTWTMRKRSYLGALQARGKVLRLSTLRYADELVPVPSLGLPEPSLSEKELAIGSELIEKMAGVFEPAKYVNEHEQKLRGLIERKARGETVAVVPPVRQQPTADDGLLPALEASLRKAA